MASLTSTNGNNQSSAHGKPDASAPQAGSVKLEDRARFDDSQHKLDELPPELVHIVDGFYPLGRLLERSAQECYNDLDETITALADIPAQINGEHATNSAGFVSAGNAQKRLRWIEFANTQRERFIKLLVLVRWSRQVNEVGKLIDIFNWMRTQDQLWDTVDDAMLNLRRTLETEKIRRPDLETALEILATGKSAKMPDLGYVQQNALTADEILETFRNINVILHLRLNIHETLPPHLQNYRIASGRVTFIIPNEFEVDLSIADEDPSSQFYFIDFRFLFSPTSEIPNGNVRAQFEARVNETLATEGLSGCYDFFHDFVLTHKINVLRRQAMTLNRTSWIGSLVVEQVHRSLIIQYWADRPGPKSWIEVGVASNRSKRTPSSLLPQPQSSLRVKWTRSGKEVAGLVDVDLNLNTTTLDCAHIIQNIIARHSNYILQTISTGVPGSVVFDNNSQPSPEKQQDDHIIRLHNIIPVLELPLLFDQTVSLRIEPTSGKFTMAPLSDQISQCVNELNGLSSGPLLPLYTSHIRQRLPSLVVGKIQESMGSWSVAVPIFDGPFPQSRLKWLENAGSCCFLPDAWKEGASPWRIGFTVDHSKQYEWCICQVKSADHHTFKNWAPLNVPEMNYELPWQRSWFIAGEAWQVIHMSMVDDILHGQYSTRGAGNVDNPTILDITHFLKDSFAPVCMRGIMKYYIARSVPEPDGTVNNSAMPSALIVRGIVNFNDDACSMFFDNTRRGAIQIRFIKGVFYVTSRGPGGPPSYEIMTKFLADAADTIRWLCRLAAYCGTLYARGFKIVDLTDSLIAFHYNQDPLLTCTIYRDSEQSITLEGTPQPHRRILPQLTAIHYGFNTGLLLPEIQAFKRLTKDLRYSLPLLQAVDAIENKPSTRYSLQISALIWSEISLAYHDINTRARLYLMSIRLINSDSPIANIKPASQPDFAPLGVRITLHDTGHASALPVPDLHNHIKAHLAAKKSENVAAFPETRAVGTGFACALDNTVAVLNEIDEAVRQVEVPARGLESDAGGEVQQAGSSQAQAQLQKMQMQMQYQQIARRHQQQQVQVQQVQQVQQAKQAQQRMGRGGGHVNGVEVVEID